jgi:NTP pyrophosphatase (non-canonical NTP hydrolase)
MQFFPLSIIATTSALFLLPESALAYGSISPSLRKYHATTTTTTTRQAIIYGGDDGEGVWEDDNESTTLFSSTAELKTAVSSQLDPQLLLRVACALAPPPNDNLHPKDCLDAHLVWVSTTGAGIAISVTTGGEVVAQVLVPITFPRPCPDANEACILETFQQLDSESYHLIAKKEWEEQHADQLAAQQQLIESLQEEPWGIDLPNWWSYAALNQGLVDECSTMKTLLNEEDFATDLNIIFQNHFQNPDFSIQTIKTCASSVGPSGLYLRSYAERTGDYDDKRLDTYFNAELALQFDTNAKSRDQLTSLVLKLVESAGEVAPTLNEPEVAMSEEGSEALAPPVKELSEEDIFVLRKKEYVFQRSLLEARLRMEHFNAELALQFDTNAKSRDQLTSLVLKLVESAGEVALTVNEPEVAMSEIGSEALAPPVKELSEEDIFVLQYAFQRSLLEARLRMEQASKASGNKRNGN